ncbi:hypothetical protein H7H37_20015, partial [Mycolicibacterium insubricum]|nr:hypothetical protein [Mycolicibacterium insubricum]
RLGALGFLAHSALGEGNYGLAVRFAALGGRLRVTSPRGDGTTVAAELPLTQWANSG